MSHTSSLPEENLVKLLACNLLVSEDAFKRHAFADYGAGRLYITHKHFAAAYLLELSSRLSCPAYILLVSKQFLRIGLPLLYNSVCLRHERHLYKLASTLHSASALGPLVRWLGFEAKWAMLLDYVVEFTPNVHTLHIRFDF